MSDDDVLGSRLEILRDTVRASFDEAPAQVQGFLARVLKAESRYPHERPLHRSMTVADCLDAVRFDGYPALARAGYCLAAAKGGPIDTDLGARFMQCIERQRGRPKPRQVELAGDALALLGIADGLRAISQEGKADRQRLEAARAWMHELLEQHGGSDIRLAQARLLASDLLDEQGRFGRRLGQADDTSVAALDLCLWRTWPDVLSNIEHPDADQRRKLFKTLLTAQPPRDGELVQATTWLCAIDVLTDEITAAIVPTAHQVARILAETQGSFRRWRWEARATRKEAIPARWLIDKEPDVQAFLLAVLYPYFKDDLQDEQYLQGYGLSQGRFDFAITSLGVIVEVKVMRTSADVKVIEAEIADDIARYFKEDYPFRTLIAYIYDDRDRPEPEKYPAIRNALKRRSDRIVDVVIVRRPSMIPDRGNRECV